GGRSSSCRSRVSRTRSAEPQQERTCSRQARHSTYRPSCGDSRKGGPGLAAVGGTLSRPTEGGSVGARGAALAQVIARVPAQCPDIPCRNPHHPTAYHTRGGRLAQQTRGGGPNRSASGPATSWQRRLATCASRTGGGFVSHSRSRTPTS